MGHDVKICLSLRFHFRKHQIGDVQIELVDKICFLEDGNELRRRYHTLYGVYPADKSLLVADVAVCRANDRLIVDLYPALFDSLVKIVDKIPAPFGFGEHFSVE